MIASCGGCGRACGPATERQAALLFNVGWRAGADGLPRCSVCLAHGDAVIEYFVRSTSSGAMYRVVLDGGTWRCACRGHRRWGHCKHADERRVAVADRRAA